MRDKSAENEGPIFGGAYLDARSLSCAFAGHCATMAANTHVRYQCDLLVDFAHHLSARIITALKAS